MLQHNTYFDDAGAYGLSSGMHLNVGCSHFVCMKAELQGIEPVVVHELEHHAAEPAHRHRAAVAAVQVGALDELHAARAQRRHGRRHVLRAQAHALQARLTLTLGCLSHYRSLLLPVLPLALPLLLLLSLAPSRPLAWPSTCC